MGITGTSLRCGLLALCAATFCLSSAHADPAPPAAGEEDSEEAALTRYMEGERHYAAGRYELAVKEFEAAFALSAKAKLHFNIANCHERAGNYTAAAASLETFLASGNPPEPEVLRERIWRLKRRALERQETLEDMVEKRVAEMRGEEKRAEEERERKRQAEEAASVPTMTAQSQVERPSFVPAYATIAGGGAMVAFSLILAGVSRSARDDAELACRDGLCTREAESSLSTETRYAVAADISGVVGLATMGVGGYLWYRTRQERERVRLQATPLAGPRSLGVVISGRF